MELIKRNNRLHVMSKLFLVVTSLQVDWCCVALLFHQMNGPTLPAFVL
jgi:hypothetical protein